MNTGDVGFALSPEQQRRLDRLGDFARTCRWEDAALFLSVTIEGTLDIERLQKALEALRERHPVLRAYFGKTAAYRGLRQFFDGPHGGFSLTAFAALETPEAAAALLRNWRERPVDIDQPEVASAFLVRTGAAQWQLVLGALDVLIDRRGLGILYEQLLDTYRGASPAEEDEAGFQQYLDWRGEVATDEDAPAAQLYWRDFLRGEDDSYVEPALPYRGENGASDRHRAMRFLDFPARAPIEAIESWSRARAQSPETVLQAAWWLLLAKVCGRSALRVGWCRDSRVDYEYFAATPGVFEKILPLHLTFDEQHGFARLLDGLSAQLESHAAYQEYWSPIAGGKTPAVGFGSALMLDAQNPDDSVWTPDEAITARGFELSLQVELTAAGTVRQVKLHYDPAHYDDVAMRGLLEQYGVLLRNIIDSDGRGLGELSILGDAERARLLALNPPPESFDDLPWLPDRIAAWADSRPDAIALVADSHTVTYAQLRREADRIAGALQQLGVGAGAIVALALPRSTALVSALLAVWRIGAAYLPLDPQWPPARQRRILEQANAAFVLADADRVDALRAEGFAADTVETLVARDQSIAADGVHVCAGDDAAYVLFTSGSTGTPKGVVIEHRQLRNYVEAASRALSLDRNAHFAFSATPAADLGHTAFYGALWHGATLHVAADATLQNARAFAAYQRDHAIDCLKIVPSHLAVLLDTEDAVLPATVVLGGEPIDAALLERISQIRPGCRVFNHYGPTETAVGVLIHPVGNLQTDVRRVPLTRVLANNRVYLLDAQQRLVATGILGEVYVGGAQLCRGYLNAAADVFIDSPFEPGERLYRTGDLARYRPEGGLQLYGRRDQQVKIRGFRIELTEIEAELLRQPEVSEAVVVLDGPADAGALAFVVLARDVDTAALAALRERLAAQLPAAMVPRRLQALERMPRLANGKIDRRALQAQAEHATESDYRAPRDALETLLEKLMAQLLDRDRLGIDQDFFAAGGHSLLVIKLAARIRKQLLCDIAPATVFDFPTVERLARALREQETTAGHLLKLAQARLHLESLSPEEKARLLERAKTTPAGA